MNEDIQPRSLYSEEEFAYPTNLTSSLIFSDENENNEYCYQGQSMSDNNPHVTNSQSEKSATSESVEIIGGKRNKNNKNDSNKEDDNRHAQGSGIKGEREGGHSFKYHPSRAENTSTGSDLVQVAVEDLLISSRTIKASMELVRQESSRPPPIPFVTIAKPTGADSSSASQTTGIITTAATTSTVTSTATVPLITAPNSPLSGPPSPSTSVPAITTTTITATVRTFGGRGTSFVFDGDAEDDINLSMAQLMAVNKSTASSHSRPSSTQLSAASEGSSQSQLPSPYPPSPSSSSSSLSNSNTSAAPTSGTIGTSQEQQRGQDVSNKRGVSQLPTVTSRKPAIPLTPAQQREAEADDNIQRAIELHERNRLEEATYYFLLAAQSENPLGQLMYGLSLRHGWGCKANPKEAIVYLQRAAEYAMGEMKVIDSATTPVSAPVHVQASSAKISGNNNNFHGAIRSQPPSSPSSPTSSIGAQPHSLNQGQDQGQREAQTPSLQSVRRMGSMDRTAAMTMARKELVMALYELGMSYLKGWGVNKDKPVAFSYFKIAADLGDPDSQNETALCYYEGIGIEKDMYESAKYYRMASAQGASQLGNSWIWKPKYDQYCAAENAAVSAAATIGSVSVVTNATSSTLTGAKKGHSKERAKKLTSAIQTAIATSNANPLSASISTSASSTPSSPSSTRSRMKPSGSWITQNSNGSSTTLSSSSHSSPTSPSIPSPQYTLSSIASGLASVTAATASAPLYNSANTGSGSVISINANFKNTSLTSPTSPHPSLSASTAPTTPTSIVPSSLANSPESLEKKKRRWTLWNGQRTPLLSSSSNSTVVIP
ncbi:hypothetical protein FBU30_009198 [Linnemannia zychae]|nr:hypothetical protein FBU30_009198 [Linnemannia zychae]